MILADFSTDLDRFPLSLTEVFWNLEDLFRCSWGDRISIDCGWYLDALSAGAQHTLGQTIETSFWFDDNEIKEASSIWSSLSPEDLPKWSLTHQGDSGDIEDQSGMLVSWAARVWMKYYLT
jgi:hypothetical protein